MKKISKLAAAVCVGLMLITGATAANDAVLAAGVRTAGEDYEQGRRALDHAEWDKARDAFARSVRTGVNVDAALYWKAYSEVKLKDYSTAQASISRLKAGFPKSEWVDDADALLLEIRGVRQGGKLPEDEELKLYALQMLMMNDPERAEPLLKKYIAEGKSDQLREKAMFILLQHPDAANSDVLGSALDQATNVQLKISAVRLLGMLGDEKSRALLDKAYRESDDNTFKHMIIQSYMMHGNAQRLADIARNEKDPGLKRQAVQMLGVTGEIERIRDLYNETEDREIRRAMMQGFALAGDGEMIFDILEKEKDPEMRRAAVQHLIMVDAPELGKKLLGIYAKSQSDEEKRAIVQAMAMHGESEALIGLYQKEQDPKIRRDILQSMALFMNDERVGDFFEEFLKED